MIWMHVSELAVDRLIAGEITGADAAAMRDHAAGCDRCGSLLDDAVAVQREFAAARPRLALPVPLVRRRTAVVGSTVAALAAALAVVIVWPHASSSPAPVRTKGASIVGFFVAHGGDVRRGAIREVVTPGDRVELATSVTEPAWFAAFSDDTSGTRSVYVAPRAILPGPDRVVPGAIELDGMLGPEIVTGVFCPRAFELDAIPDDCTRDRFTLVKVSR